MFLLIGVVAALITLTAFDARLWRQASDPPHTPRRRAVRRLMARRRSHRGASTARWWWE